MGKTSKRIQRYLTYAIIGTAGFLAGVGFGARSERSEIYKEVQELGHSIFSKGNSYVDEAPGKASEYMEYGVIMEDTLRVLKSPEDEERKKARSRLENRLTEYSTHRK